MYAMITLIVHLPLWGRSINRYISFSEPTKDIFVKIFLYLMGIGFAVLFSLSVNAEANSREIMTLCKGTVMESIHDVTRISTKQFKKRQTKRLLLFVFLHAPIRQGKFSADILTA
ncbi:MAG: hypothetical protein CMQ40_00150 [Gammaproteobacteria bacterium]|nr:hypothetical protein [Gammaproteobacteria bacterium]